MDAMAGGRRDALPGLLGRSLLMALLAGLSRNLGMGRHLVRALHDPVVHLLGLCFELEGVAGVTGEAVVRPLHLVDQQVGPGVGSHEGLAAGHEDVAAPAEIVVVHHVVVRLHAGPHHQQEHGSHRRGEPELDTAVPGDQPRPDRPPAAPEEDRGDDPHDRAQHDATTHDPARLLEEPLDDGNHRVGQRRIDDDGIDESPGERVLGVDGGGLQPIGPGAERRSEADETGHETLSVRLDQRELIVSRSAGPQESPVDVVQDRLRLRRAAVRLRP